MDNKNLCGKIESELEINASTEEFIKVFKTHDHQFPTTSDFHHVEHHESVNNLDIQSSIKNWKFDLAQENKEEDAKLVMKEKVEKIDEEYKTMQFNVLDGDNTNHYKSLKGTLQAFAKNGKNFVKWTLDFEKLKEEAPTPQSFVNFVHKVTRDVDTHCYKP